MYGVSKSHPTGTSWFDAPEIDGPPYPQPCRYRCRSDGVVSHVDSKLESVAFDIRRQLQQGECGRNPLAGVRLLPPAGTRTPPARCAPSLRQLRSPSGAAKGRLRPDHITRTPIDHAWVLVDLGPRLRRCG
jgi:hypothetical protein